jgi:predicted SPOUT superfamily RNA methylase MTH1
MASTTRVTLDFDLRKEPIEGRLRAEDSHERTFTGYMQLVTELEAALGDARTADHARVASRTDGAVHERSAETSAGTEIASRGERTCGGL